jgi:hypothetical protein
LSVRQKSILKILMAGIKMTVSEITESMDNPPSARTVGDDLSPFERIGIG